MCRTRTCGSIDPPSPPSPPPPSPSPPCSTPQLTSPRKLTTARDAPSLITPLASTGLPLARASVLPVSAHNGAIASVVLPAPLLDPRPSPPASPSGRASPLASPPPPPPAAAQDIRQSSNVSYELHRASEIIEREPSEDDLTVKDKTDCFKLAGAIAGRVRDGEDVSITTKGPVPVLVTTKAIALAQEYVAEEGLSLSFTVQFRDLEDPSLRGSPVSTFVQFIIVREA
mmetsp:Transcript_36625/g.118113  ORF Transcript_36625/g.118113 Transcript_36625/m.118113 type:complete len:228 (+) Transcript_36625:1223-1906(+)